MDAARKSQLDTFIWETREHLDRIEPDVIALRGQPDDPERVNNIFRGIHSIKGGAGFFSLRKIEELSHGLEQVMSAAREGELPVGDAVIHLLLSGIDKLRAMADDTSTSDNLDIDPELRQIEALLSAGQTTSSPSGPAGFPLSELLPFRVTPEQVGDVEKKGLFVFKARCPLSGQGGTEERGGLIAKIEAVGQVLDTVTRLPDAGTGGGEPPVCLALFATVLQSDMIDIALDLPKDSYVSVPLEALRSYADQPPRPPPSPLRRNPPPGAPSSAHHARRKNRRGRHRSSRKTPSAFRSPCSTT